VPPDHQRRRRPDPSRRLSLLRGGREHAGHETSEVVGFAGVGDGLDGLGVGQELVGLAVGRGARGAGVGGTVRLCAASRPGCSALHSPLPPPRRYSFYEARAPAPLNTKGEETTTMNFLNLGQYNYGILSGPQTNAAVVMQGTAWLNSASIHQTNIGFGSGPQTNVAVVSQGH
jgi:hypothetical protein